MMSANGTALFSKMIKVINHHLSNPLARDENNSNAAYFFSKKGEKLMGSKVYLIALMSDHDSA
jgi:hypothetical protein